MILQPDAKCVTCGGSIFHRNKRHKLAMHVGVENGPRHADCGVHEVEEIKRKRREQRQEK